MTALVAPILLGNGTSAAGAALTITITVGASTAIGDTIVVFVGTEGLNDTSGVTDSAGNTYVTTGGALTTSGTKQRIYQCVNAPNALTSGVSTITGTWTLTTPAKALVAASVSNVTAIDQQTTGTTGISTNPAGNTDTLANNNEIVFAQGVALTGNSETLTDDFNFANLAYQPMGVGAMWVSWFEPGTPSAVYYSGTLSASDTWGLKLVALKGAAIAAPFASSAARMGGNHASPPARIKTRYGYYNTQSLSLTFYSGNLMGLNVGRYSIRGTVPGDSSTYAAAYVAAGWKAAIIFSNQAPPPASGPAPPPTDFTLFSSQVAAAITTNNPYLILVENEEDGGIFFKTQCADNQNPYVSTGQSSFNGSISSNVLTISGGIRGAPTVTFTNGSSTIAGTFLPPVATTVSFMTTGTLPSPLTVGTTYYVLDGGSDTAITISATLGGTPIVMNTGGMSGTHTMPQLAIGYTLVGATAAGSILTSTHIVGWNGTNWTVNNAQTVSLTAIVATQTDPATYPATSIATAAAYMNELAAATRIAHQMGYKISNGGTTETGLFLAYWHYLANIGRLDLATTFADVTLSRTTLIHQDVTSDLPTPQYPNRPILANNPGLLLHMYTCEAMLPLYKNTQCDYWNWHGFYGIPDTEQPILALSWGINQVGNMIPIMSATGSRSANPLTMTAAGTIGPLFNMPIMMCYQGAGGTALPLADPITGALTSIGVAYQQVVANYGAPPS